MTQSLGRSLPIVTVREYHAALTRAGEPHSDFEVEGFDHNQRKMINGRKRTWFDFHFVALKKNGVELHHRKS